MSYFRKRHVLISGMCLAVLGVVCCTVRSGETTKAAGAGGAGENSPLDWQVPRDAWKMPFIEEQPIFFINRSQNADEWNKLPAFWNPTTFKGVDLATGKEVERKAVKVKVPLGLQSNPAVPFENPMTVQKWALGKRLYFDPILSSNSTVACASCHEPSKGFTDQAAFSTGIDKKLGGMSAPTVLNSAFYAQQFWDGRASSLEDQAQGPVQNPLEMWDGQGNAWHKAVERLRKDESYVKQFRLVFGTDPTRDAAAKAIATYERTVLTGNAIQDRAEVVMRTRVDAAETGKYELIAADYAKTLEAAFAAKDENALKALKLDPARDKGRIGEVSASLLNGRNLFFNKARCNSCHVGDNLSDLQYHNLGVGAKDDRLPEGGLGRFASLPLGQKNPDTIGAFKTSGLRQLLSTAPYMHDGSEKTLEDVVAFYDRGGNANEFLDVKMRDFDAEKAWLQAQKDKKPYKGPEVRVINGKPIAPLKLNLSDQEKKDLVLFLRAMQGDPADSTASDKTWFPK